MAQSTETSSPLASFHRLRLFDEAISPTVSTEFVRMNLETVWKIHESGFALQAVDGGFGFCFGFVHANQKLYVSTFISLAHKPQTVHLFACVFHRVLTSVVLTNLIF